MPRQHSAKLAPSRITGQLLPAMTRSAPNRPMTWSEYRRSASVSHFQRTTSASPGRKFHRHVGKRRSARDARGPRLPSVLRNGRIAEVVERDLELRQALRHRQHGIELRVVDRDRLEDETRIGEHRKRFQHRRLQEPFRVGFIGNEMPDADQLAATLDALQRGLGCGGLGERHPADDAGDDSASSTGYRGTLPSRRHR